MAYDKPHYQSKRSVRGGGKVGKTQNAAMKSNPVGVRASQGPVKAGKRAGGGKMRGGKY